jgi:DNA-binding transcriptional MerR regulator
VPKSAHAFRTISEAADEVGAPQHVLRFWEGKFPFLQPVKRAGGRRFYRPADIALLKALKRLLHEDGMTIRGVQKLHKDGGLKRLLGEEAAEALEAAPARSGAAPDRADLQALIERLEGARARLDAALAG